MHPEAAFDLEEKQEDVKRAFDELSEMQLKVLILTRLQRLKYKEVAQELGISLNTVRTHKDRAIKKLKELLGVRSKEKR
jgi:RNA polymerase sigma-70 factor (ECF subfamily)